MRGAALVYAASLLTAGDAQGGLLKKSLVPTYFDSHPEDCSGPDDCSVDALNRLTHHVRNGLYWGGAAQKKASASSDFSCDNVTSTGMCLQWGGSLSGDDRTTLSESGSQVCQCEISRAPCHAMESPGNLSLYANGICDAMNFKDNCGWDGGDCDIAFGLREDLSLPVGSDYYCAAWSCTKEKTDLTTRCRGSYFYRYYSFYYYSGWGWRRLDSSHNSAHLFEGRRLELEHRRQLRCYLDLNDVYGYEECVCVAASMNDRYCAKWYCEEELSDLTASEDDEDNKELVREWFECTLESDDGQTCWRWSGVMQTSIVEDSWDDGELVLRDCGRSAGDDDGVALLGRNDPVEYGEWECSDAVYSFWQPGWTVFGIGVVFIFVVLTCVLQRIRQQPEEALRGFCHSGRNPFVFNVLLIVWWFLGWWEAGIVGGVTFTALIGAIYVIAWRFGAFRKSRGARVTPESRASHRRSSLSRNRPRQRRANNPEDIEYPVAMVQMAEVAETAPSDSEIPTAKTARGQPDSVRSPAPIVEASSSSSNPASDGSLPVAEVVVDRT
eukprot:INCI2539.2.p1 GENE.INCI2539.2~~INCI2539.2.p1  ORF type:complete len:553 (+),score=67.45 INCI2539.2:204-1862(+)